MFISEKRFNSAMNEHMSHISKLNNKIDLLERNIDMHKHDIHMLVETLRQIIKTMIVQDKKSINMEQILRFVVQDKDKDIIIAITKDGTELTLGDFLEADDMFPEVEEEFNVARFVKEL